MYRNAVETKKFRPQGGAAAGNRYGTFEVKHGTDRQAWFLRKLLAERNIEGLTFPEDLDSMNRKATSDMIKVLLSCPMAPKSETQATVVEGPSEKQLYWIKKMLAEKEDADVVFLEITGQVVDDDVQISKKDASRLLDRLFKLQDKPVEGGLTPGVFEKGDEVFIVKFNKAKTNLYAMRMVELNDGQGDRLSEDGKHVRVEFEYAAGMVRHLTQDDRMSLEKGKELCIRYGRCISCSRKLKLAESIERGMGAVCASYYA